MSLDLDYQDYDVLTCILEIAKALGYRRSDMSASPKARPGNEDALRK